MYYSMIGIYSINKISQKVLTVSLLRRINNTHTYTIQLFIKNKRREEKRREERREEKRGEKRRGERREEKIIEEKRREEKTREHSR